MLLSRLSKNCFCSQLGWCHYGRFPRVETIGEIEKKELASIGDLHTYLSKLTDKVTMTTILFKRILYLFIT